MFGIPPGIRTPTSGFGDRYAAVTLERYKLLVPQPGLEPGRLAAVDFESTVSTIPPPGHCLGGSGEIRTHGPLA